MRENACAKNRKVLKHCDRGALGSGKRIGGDAPANAQLNDFSVEHPSAVDGVTVDWFGHSEPLLEPESYAKTRRCTGAPLPIVMTRC